MPAGPTRKGNLPPPQRPEPRRPIPWRAPRPIHAGASGESAATASPGSGSGASASRDIDQVSQQLQELIANRLPEGQELGGGEREERLDRPKGALAVPPARAPSGLAKGAGHEMNEPPRILFPAIAEQVEHGPFQHHRRLGEGEHKTDRVAFEGSHHGVHPLPSYRRALLSRIGAPGEFLHESFSRDRDGVNFHWRREGKSGMLPPGAFEGGTTMAQEIGRTLSRRPLLTAVGTLAGCAAAAPLVNSAQDPGGGPVSPPTTVTNPPRDFSPGGPPTTYFTDPDILTVDPAFNALVQVNTPIQRLWTGALWMEGPAWNSQGRYLVWSDIPNNRQLRWLEDDARVTVFRSPSNNSNGNTFDFQGRQLSCEHLTRRVVRYEHDGSVSVIAHSYNGKRLNSPNDVVPQDR